MCKALHSIPSPTTKKIYFYTLNKPNEINKSFIYNSIKNYKILRDKFCKRIVNLFFLLVVLEPMAASAGLLRISHAHGCFHGKMEDYTVRIKISATS
jgi:hypothetical protein